ncbi:hypothetical protein L1F30_07585 [Simiduia sp. 21SJ11W-1]|uniref:DUF6763 family protein n=1 Tax=Simiduia sp. 21SJ11W-1 TaxID=2909669 RepID=UPI0020A1A236|nr:DUF6763 family protein [Simiduia sp. 21SJ11W-1]UTA49388.1 hypothetical protein L1F30_07585 [Simiduia sp. 21SJ11W-1]
MLTPHTGQWYNNRETNQYFEVVALDPDHATIEIQYADGSLDEIDAELWPELTLAAAAPPEDPTSAYETGPGLKSQCGIDGEHPIEPLDIEKLEAQPFTGTEADD